MEIVKYLDEFCKDKGCKGIFNYDKNNKEYSIILTLENENGGAWLSIDEYEGLTSVQC